MKNCRKPGDASQRPSGSVSAASKPMTNEPLTLTASVPHGNVSPTREATTPESQ